MPSPIGHALAGLAAAWLVNPPPRDADRLRSRPLMRQVAVFGAVALLPDLDLMWGHHSAQTHGLGAALIVGLAGWAVVRQSRFIQAPAWRIGLAVAAAYASHTLLDWLGSDSSPPIGIMALWPVSQAYFESDLHLFMAISRRYWRAGFWEQNVAAVMREVLILAPIVLAVVLVRGRGRRKPGNRLSRLAT